ncbi:hypothetical protein [Microvirga sp. 17 mud 1-3]|uniref:hypothetical protein n=1 Tax=Microvirga sp. 17 mud 1-3 TaxID=2082949 RepID=UPI0013A5835C|nr:hypothetical protein [Microvirga sp. 17 mud 1-3]
MTDNDIERIAQRVAEIVSAMIDEQLAETAGILIEAAKSSGARNIRPDDSAVSDKWEIPVSNFITGKPETTVPEVLCGIGVPSEKHGKAEQMRIGKILKSLGYQRKKLRRDGKPKNVWVIEERNYEQ